MASQPDMLQHVKTLLTIDIHPSKLACVLEGVREHLNGLLLQYNEDLDGVPLAYSNERIVSSVAMVHPYFPFTQLNVSASFITFRPKAGDRVIGIVNKVSEAYIGLLVLGFINAVVRAQNVRRDIRPRELGALWSSTKDPNHSIAAGDTVAFTVIEAEHSGSYVSLSGSLMNSGTGNVAIVGLEHHASAKEGKKVSKGKKQSRKEKKDKEGLQRTAVPSNGMSGDASKSSRGKGKDAVEAAEGSTLGEAARKRSSKRKQSSCDTASPEASDPLEKKGNRRKEGRQKEGEKKKRKK